MKTKVTGLIVVIIMVALINCGASTPSTPSTIDNPNDLAQLQTFYNTYSGIMTTYNVPDSGTLTNDLQFFKDYHSIVGSLSPSALATKVNYTIPPNDAAANAFYGKWYSLIGTQTVPAVGSLADTIANEDTFYATYKSVIDSLLANSNLSGVPTYNWSSLIDSLTTQVASLTSQVTSLTTDLATANATIASTQQFVIDTTTTIIFWDYAGTHSSYSTVAANGYIGQTNSYTILGVQTEYLFQIVGATSINAMFTWDQVQSSMISGSDTATTGPNGGYSNKYVNISGTYTTVSGGVTTVHVIAPIQIYVHL